jgi:hypothetical protein
VLTPTPKPQSNNQYSKQERKEGSLTEKGGKFGQIFLKNCGEFFGRKKRKYVLYYGVVVSIISVHQEGNTMIIFD